MKLATGAWPVPVRGTLSGLLAALVTKVRLAALEPTVRGVKVIPTIQLSPGPTEPQELLEIAKLVGLVPVRVILVILKVADPVLVRVTF